MRRCSGVFALLVLAGCPEPKSQPEPVAEAAVEGTPGPSGSTERSPALAADTAEPEAESTPPPEPEPTPPEPEPEPEPPPRLEGPLPLPELAGIGRNTSKQDFRARFSKFDDPPREGTDFAWRTEKGAGYETPLIQAHYIEDDLFDVRLSYRPEHPPSEFGLEGPWIDLLGKDSDSVAAVLGQPSICHGEPVKPGQTPLTNKKMFPNRHAGWSFENVEARDGSKVNLYVELYFRKFGDKKVKPSVASSVRMVWSEPRGSEPAKPTLQAVEVPQAAAPVEPAPVEFAGAPVARATFKTQSIEREAGGVGVDVSYPSFTMVDPGRAKAIENDLSKRLLQQARTLTGEGESGTYEFECTVHAATEFLVSLHCAGMDERMLDEDLKNGTGGGGVPEQWTLTYVASGPGGSSMSSYDVASAFPGKSPEDLLWVAAAITSKEELLEDGDVEKAIERAGSNPFDEGTAVAFFDESGLAIWVCEDPGAGDCLELGIPYPQAAAIASSDGPVQSLWAVYRE